MKAIKIIRNIATACLLVSFASCNNTSKAPESKAETEDTSNLTKFDGFDIYVPEGYEATTYPFPTIPLVLEKGDVMIEVTKAKKICLIQTVRSILNSVSLKFQSRKEYMNSCSLPKQMRKNSQRFQEL